MDPFHFSPALQQVPHMRLQIILRLHQRVPRLRKKLHRLPRPQPAVRSNIQNMFRREPELLQQSKKRFEPVARPRTILDPHDPVSQFAENEVDKFLHLRRTPLQIPKQLTRHGAEASLLGEPAAAIENTVRRRPCIGRGSQTVRYEERAPGALFSWTGGWRGWRNSDRGKTC